MIIPGARVPPYSGSRPVLPRMIILFSGLVLEVVPRLALWRRHNVRDRDRLGCELINSEGEVNQSCFLGRGLVTMANDSPLILPSSLR
jgi:hypothetical protein